LPKTHICNIERIQNNFEEVKEKFQEINLKIQVPRDEFNDFVAGNMLLAYEKLNKILISKMNLFSDKNVLEIIELNHTVLCGNDETLRYEFKTHLEATKKKFFEGLRPVKKWFNKHDGKDSALKVAAEIYVGMLSQPQMFIEGNHRTGSIVASWILLRGGYPPFVLTYKNAESYFNPSSQIKFSDKRVIRDKLKLPKYEKSFKDFLEKNIKKRFMITKD